MPNPSNAKLINLGKNDNHPPEGKQSWTFYVDLTANKTAVINLGGGTTFQSISRIRSIAIINQEPIGGQAITSTVTDSQQVISTAPQAASYLPLFSRTPLQLTISVTAFMTTQLIVIVSNFDSPATILGSALGGGSNISFSDNETPAGAINGVNKAFTLANVPQGTPLIYLNGVLQILATDYTINGLNITFTKAPIAGDVLTAYYRY